MAGVRQLGSIVLKNTFFDWSDGEEEPVVRRRTMPELRRAVAPGADEDQPQIAVLNFVWSGVAPPAEYGAWRSPARVSCNQVAEAGRLDHQLASQSPTGAAAGPSICLADQGSAPMWSDGLQRWWASVEEALPSSPRLDPSAESSPWTWPAASEPSVPCSQGHAAGTGRVVLKNTFFDISDGEEEEPVGRRRSMPELRPAPAEEDIAQLPALNSVWSGLALPGDLEPHSARRALLAASLRAKDELAAIRADGSQFPSSRAVKSWAEPRGAPEFSFQRGGGASKCDGIQQRLQRCQSLAEVSTETLPPWMSHATSSPADDPSEVDAVESPTSDLQPIPAAGESPSAGSQGHVAGACRPCLYVRSKKGCKFGASCGFCHIATGHAEPAKSRPGKGKRERIRKALALEAARSLSA